MNFRGYQVPSLYVPRYAPLRTSATADSPLPSYPMVDLFIHVSEEERKVERRLASDSTSLRLSTPLFYLATFCSSFLCITPSVLPY
jgi:hypothetical protein